MFTKQKDGSIIAEDGRVIFFSLKRFVEDICSGECCFLCGANPKHKVFNNEHVIPKWVLKTAKLFDKYLTLPNHAKVRYDKYTLPCCVECNSYLGTRIEEEIRNATKDGFDGLRSYVEKHGHFKLFLWLALLFLKTHLKDTQYRKRLNESEGIETIASDYDFALLHHIHCMVRALQSGIGISKNCLGTFKIFKVKEAPHIDSFDFKDVYIANTILIRINDFAMITVLDDSCAASQFFSSHSSKITGLVSAVQLREIFAHLAFLNLKLKYRPSYFTVTNSGSNKAFIDAKFPEEMCLDSWDEVDRGMLLYSCVQDLIMQIPSLDQEKLKKEIIHGNHQFLFDKDGNFDYKSFDTNLSNKKH